MADERDPKVSQRYRDLGSEEPPRELDQTILAAGRRAVDKPHAPLVTPAGRHRWYFSLGAAAIIVLAVAVTLHVDRQQPDPESVVAARAPETQEAPAQVEKAKKPAPKPQAAPGAPAAPVFVPDPKPRVMEAPRELARERAGTNADAVGAAAGPRAESQAAPATEMQGQRSPPAEARSAPAPMAAGKPAAGGYVDTPERSLERIAELRKDGRHDEADKALAEFRKAYPDYRIPELMLEKVEKR